MNETKINLHNPSIPQAFFYDKLKGFSREVLLCLLTSNLKNQTNQYAP